MARVSNWHRRTNRKITMWLLPKHSNRGVPQVAIRTVGGFLPDMQALEAVVQHVIATVLERVGSKEVATPTDRASVTEAAAHVRDEFFRKYHVVHCPKKAAC